MPDHCMVSQVVLSYKSILLFAKKKKKKKIHSSPEKFNEKLKILGFDCQLTIFLPKQTEHCEN